MVTEGAPMKVVFTILLLILAANAASAQGETRTTPEKLSPKIAEFLKPGGELKRPKTTFTGEIVPIPGDMRQLLAQDLYLHDFTIVKMKISLDISSTYEELLIITDAKSGNVVSYLWQYALAGPPESFSKLLMAYPNETWRLNTYWPEMSVLAKISTLGKAVLYMARDTGMASRIGLEPRVGSLGSEEKNKSYVLTADLIPWFSPTAKIVLNLNWVRDIDDAANNYFQREYAYGQLKIVVPKEQ